MTFIIVDFGNKKPPLGFHTDTNTKLPYIGGLVLSTDAGHSQRARRAKTEQPASLHGSFDGLLLAVLAFLLIGLAVPVILLFSRTAGKR